MIISQNTTFGTTMRLLAPRIEITWNPETNDGPVAFHLEQMTTKPHPEGWTQTLERSFARVLEVSISDLVGQTYAIVEPDAIMVDQVSGATSAAPGQTISEPGYKLLLGIKAATRAAYDANVAQPDPEADPLARRIVILWNPINDGGDVTFQVSDRGADLGVLAASIADLVGVDYTIPKVDGSGTEVLQGWKLQAMIKAATNAAIAASMAPSSQADVAEDASAS